MWDDIKNLFGWICLVFTIMLAASLFTGAVIIAGWMNGMKHFAVDMGVSVSDIAGNEAILYGITAALMLIIIYVSAKVLEAMDAGFLWLVMIVCSAALVIAPYFYHIYVAHGVWLHT